MDVLLTVVIFVGFITVIATSHYNGYKQGFRDASNKKTGGEIMSYENLTIKDLIDLGYDIDVWIHKNENKDSALEALSRFDGLAKIEESSDLEKDVQWVEMSSLKLKVTAFYEVQKATADTAAQESIDTQ